MRVRFQYGLFEDRLMKIDHVTIGRRVYMSPRSAVLYSAVVGDNAKLGALTLVMEGRPHSAGHCLARLPGSASAAVRRLG